MYWLYPRRSTESLIPTFFPEYEYKGTQRAVSQRMDIYIQQKKMKKVLSMEDMKKMLFVTPNPSREEIDVTLSNKQARGGGRRFGERPGRRA